MTMHRRPFFNTANELSLRAKEVPMTMLWIVLGLIGVFLAYHFALGFFQALGIRHRPKFRVIGFDKEN
jgi:hypothetical protein